MQKKKAVGRQGANGVECTLITLRYGTTVKGITCSLLHRMSFLCSLFGGERCDLLWNVPVVSCMCGVQPYSMGI